MNSHRIPDEGLCDRGLASSRIPFTRHPELTGIRMRGLKVPLNRSQERLFLVLDLPLLQRNPRTKRGGGLAPCLNGSSERGIT